MYRQWGVPTARKQAELDLIQGSPHLFRQVPLAANIVPQWLYGLANMAIMVKVSSAQKVHRKCFQERHPPRRKVAIWAGQEP